VISTKGYLIALGGFSGSGKSTIARLIQPELQAAVVEIDSVWKNILGIGQRERAPPGAYTPERRKLVLAEYDRLCSAALLGGRNVIAQKVFAKPDERSHIESLAWGAGALFRGIWLEAPADILKKRVRERVNDVSDVPESVIDRQLTMDVGKLSWARINSNRDFAEILRDISVLIAN
jgi:predicted kinase